MFGIIYFAFVEIQFFDESISKKLIIGVTIVLSVISYYFIEKPFRSKKDNFKNFNCIININLNINCF